jgi:hypothetical protein
MIYNFTGIKFKPVARRNFFTSWKNLDAEKIEAEAHDEQGPDDRLSAA